MGPYRIAVGATIAILLSGCGPGPKQPPQRHGDPPGPGTSETSPYFDVRSQEAEYHGPGRDTAPPDDLTEIRIGWFGPDDPDHPTGGPMWLAANLVVERANGDGGYNGLPFRLLPCWSENPWGTGVKDVTRLVYEDKVWAIAGAPDGPSAHLVEQVTAKARLPFLSCASTDRTANLANVPWTFSLVPADDAVARVLAPAIVDEAAGRGVVLVSATDHDSRMTVKELLAELNRLDAFPSHHLHIRPKVHDYYRPLAIIQRADPGVVVLIAGAVDSARFLGAMREAALGATVFAGPNAARRCFHAHAGKTNDGVRLAMLWEPNLIAGGFVDSFVRQDDRPPDYTAAFTFDAMNLLMEAIREAGLNRARIRDAIRRMSGRVGVTGRIIWDPTGQNTISVQLGVIRDGVIVPHRPAASHTHSRTD